MRRRRLVLVLALTLVSACASLSVKQKVSNAHLTVHAALVAVDDLELRLCGPVPSAPWTCGAQPRVISDSDHQRLSRLLADAFQADARLGRAIIAWEPGTTAPKDLDSLRTYMAQVEAIVTALAPTTESRQLLEFVRAVLAAVADVSVIFTR